MSQHSLSGARGRRGHTQETQQEKAALYKQSGAGLQSAAARDTQQGKYLKLRWGNGKTLAPVIQELILERALSEAINAHQI